MKFKQTYSIYESDFGSREIIIVISDSYSDLFTATEGYIVNNIQIKNVKQELNIEENSFAVDSFQFTIRETSAITENEKNCLSFVLHASDLKRFRFIGVFFDSISTANKLFAGQISSKIGGNDIYYDADSWGIDNSKREYNFSALSFDISILQKVLFNERIEKEDGSFVNGMYERIDADTTFLGNCGFTSKASFYYGDDTYFTYPIAPLYNVISAYLSKASDILTELLGYSLILTLQESNLDFKVNTMVYDFTNSYNTYLYDYINQEVSATKYDAQIKLDEGLWIHRGFIRSNLVGSYNNPSGNYNAVNETAMTFEQFNNLAEFLSSIAKNLGCFIKVTENAGTLLLKFINRGTVISSDNTYLIGFREGSIDTSSALVKEGNEYFAKSTYWTADGFDALDCEWQHDISESLKKQGNKIAEAEKKKIEYEPLLFSTAPILRSKEYVIDECLGVVFPFNVLNGNDTFIEAYSNSSYQMVNYSVYDLDEVFTSALYIKNQENPKGTWANVYRPAYNISVNVNGEEQEFATLSDYINYLIGREKQYYETERNLTIPYWNGFKKLGVDSWKNLILGAKFNETIKVRDFVGEVWSENDVTKTYVITSIEWNLEKPEVKIKGQLSEKYSFITPSSTTQLVESFSITPNTRLTISDNIKSGIAAANIYQYQAVIKLRNGEIAAADSSYLEGILVGIALNDALINETVYYQINGNVSNDFGFTHYENALIVKSGATTGLNYTDDWATYYDSNAYRVMTVGLVINANTFKIKLNDYVLNEYVPV